MQIQSPVRARHSYTQRLAASPARVFPLLCPVREAEWIPGWDPRLVISRSGSAEAGCVFFTPGDSGESIWVVTEYRPEDFRIAFVKVTPGHTVGEIAIRLRPDGSDAALAEITYAYTALSPAGERAVREFTPEEYQGFMRTWEERLNHFLRTGRMLVAAP